MATVQTRTDGLKYIKNILPAHPITCEIGFFKGEFSKHINEILEPQKHYVVDLFSDLNHVSGDKDGLNYQSQDMTLMFDYAKSLGYFPIKGNSFSLQLMENNHLDFVYIDADHCYEWVFNDLNNSFPKMKNGGVIGGHDYNWTGCKLAVEQFCEMHNLKIDVMANDQCPSFFIVVNK